MNKKVLVILVLVFMLSLTQAAIADEVVETAELENSESIPLELTIDDAVKLAVENSSEIWKIDSDIAKAKDLLRVQHNSKSNIKEKMDKMDQVGIMFPSDNYLSVMLTKKGYYTKSAQMQLTLTEYGKKQLLEGIETSAKSAYYKVLLAQKAVQLNEKNLQKAEEQLKILGVKFENGSATKLDILQGELAVNQARTDIDNAEDSLALELLSFKNTVGLQLDQEVILTEEIEYIPLEEIHLDKLINQAKEQRMEVLQAKEMLEVQKIEHEAYTSYYTSSNWQHKNAVRNLSYAEKSIENSYKNVELDVRKKYLELVKAERALNNMDTTIELSKEAVRITGLFYDYGMATALEVLDADTKLTQAEIGRYQLLVSYNITKMMFDNACGLGMPQMN